MAPKNLNKSSAKIQKGAKAAPKTAPKASALKASAPAAKKSLKTAPKAIVAAPQQEASAMSDDDDLDDMEMGSEGGSSGGLTPALTKEDGPTAPMTTKNFRNHPDMENFFRFIYENDLRHEALQIIDEIIVERVSKKQLKKVQPNA